MDLFYGLNDKCINCGDDATLFKRNTSTGFYEVVGTGEQVDDLLNDEAVNQHFGMTWTKQLDLVELLNVTISGVFSKSLIVGSGTPLNEVGNLSDYFNDEEWCVGDGDSQPRIAFKPTHPVARNMNVVVGKCMSVTVGAPIHKSETMIAGEKLGHLAIFFGFSLSNFIVVVKGSDQVLNQSSVIERDSDETVPQCDSAQCIRKSWFPCGASTASSKQHRPCGLGKWISLGSIKPR